MAFSLELISSVLFGEKYFAELCSPGVFLETTAESLPCSPMNDAEARSLRLDAPLASCVTVAMPSFCCVSLTQGLGISGISARFKIS